MKVRYYLAVALMCGLMPATAQETYENANIATGDLNGTARYVGMGGAMDALGADISTIATSPAGIGLFRHSTASMSFGLVSQDGAEDFSTGNKTNLSFDQIGFVYSNRLGRSSFVNFGFNYHKSRNFNHILKAAGRMAAGASQNKMSYNKGVAAAENGWDFVEIKDDEVISNDLAYSVTDYLYYNTILYNPLIDPSGKDIYHYYSSERYMMDRASKGYIGEYDFNISGNINDRVYLGLTVGLHDVHYKSYSEYAELFSPNHEGLGGSLLEDSREITGLGFDLKAGVIFRPFENSPFRIGMSIATPTWYDLTTRNYTTLLIDDTNANPETYRGLGSLSLSESYDFKLYTPWRFGLSLGHTIGNYLALGASYEYADYGNLDSRVNDGYDYYGNETSVSDEWMNEHTKNTLKGVSTLKLGAEFKPDPAIAVRLGFNYVSPMYEKNGMKDGTLDSYGVMYQSATDCTNWKDTYRVTAGIGYRIDKLSLDLAYQYSQTDGTFRPFTDVLDASNVADAVDLSNKRNQLLFTVGYTF